MPLFCRFSPIPLIDFRARWPPTFLPPFRRPLPQVQPNVAAGSAECRRRFSWICNPAGVSIRICNPINEFLFLTFSAKNSFIKVLFLFNRITNPYTHSSQIANLAERREQFDRTCGMISLQKLRLC